MLIPILSLHMNREKLGPNLSFTNENKSGNLHKVRLPTFQTQWMRYYINSNFINLSMSWENMFSVVFGKIKFWTHHELERPWIKILTIYIVYVLPKQATF